MWRNTRHFLSTFCKFEKRNLVKLDYFLLINSTHKLNQTFNSLSAFHFSPIPDASWCPSEMTMDRFIVFKFLLYCNPGPVCCARQILSKIIDNNLFASICFISPIGKSFFSFTAIVFSPPLSLSLWFEGSLLEFPMKSFPHFLSNKVLRLNR